MDPVRITPELATASEPKRLDALALAALGGDDHAAEQLFDRARERLVRVALALAAPPTEVPDLVQEVLLAAWRHLDRFDPSKGSFVAWLIPGLRGRIHNLRRSGGRRRKLVEALARLWPWGVAKVPPASGRGAIEARLTVATLLGALTDRQREVIALYEIEGLSASETARLLRISEATVRSTARHARRRLRDEALRLDAPQRPRRPR